MICFFLKKKKKKKLSFGVVARMSMENFKKAREETSLVQKC
jgi:hypothetical protein